MSHTPLPVPNPPADSYWSDSTVPSLHPSTSLELESDDAKFLCERHDRCPRQPDTEKRRFDLTDLPGISSVPDVQDSDSETLNWSLSETGDESTKKEEPKILSDSLDPRMLPRTSTSAERQRKRSRTLSSLVQGLPMRVFKSEVNIEEMECAVPRNGQAPSTRQ